jgi:hypothetical protein
MKYLIIYNYDGEFDKVSGLHEYADTAEEAEEIKRELALNADYTNIEIVEVFPITDM